MRRPGPLKTRSRKRYVGVLPDCPEARPHLQDFFRRVLHAQTLGKAGLDRPYESGEGERPALDVPPGSPISDGGR